MKRGQPIKAFIAIGSQKEPTWQKGEFVSSFANGMDAVKIHNQQVVVSRNNLKRFEPLPLDENNYYPALKEFVDREFDKLAELITKAANHFFPDEPWSVDKENQIIYMLDESVSITCDIVEINTIGCVQERPGWTVTTYRHLPATRHESPDVAESVVGHSLSTRQAAQLFIKTVWEQSSFLFWENLDE